MADTKMISTMQYGSVTGKQCRSAVLKKVLSHDHVQITKSTASFIENDAIGCYNRLVNNLVLMLLVKLGLPKSAADCIGTLWDEVIHLVKPYMGRQLSPMVVNQTNLCMVLGRDLPVAHYSGCCVTG